MTIIITTHGKVDWDILKLKLQIHRSDREFFVASYWTIANGKTNQEWASILCTDEYPWPIVPFQTVFSDTKMLTYLQILAIVPHRNRCRIRTVISNALFNGRMSDNRSLDTRKAKKKPVASTTNNLDIINCWGDAEKKKSGSDADSPKIIMRELSKLRYWTRSNLTRQMSIR